MDPQKQRLLELANKIIKSEKRRIWIIDDFGDVDVYVGHTEDQELINSLINLIPFSQTSSGFIAWTAQENETQDVLFSIMDKREKDPVPGFYLFKVLIPTEFRAGIGLQIIGNMVNAQMPLFWDAMMKIIEPDIKKKYSIEELRRRLIYPEED